ncbi:MAG: hypothetical protein RL217_407 [Pseudomonadota bacterium]
MGRSINKVTLLGTIGRDPEVRSMPGGGLVANLSLATDESYNDKQTGQKVEQTEWHRLVVYGRLAEIVQQYLKKGSKAYFEGRLKTREWEKDGIKRYTTEIVATDMVMLGGGQEAGFNAQAGHAPVQNYTQSAAQTATPSYAQAAPQANPVYGAAQSGYQTQPVKAQPMQQPVQQPMAQPMPQTGYQSAPNYAGGYSQPAQQPPVQQPPMPNHGGFNDSFDDEIPF